MATAATPTDLQTPGAPVERFPVIAVDMPVLFEDEGQEEMGESNPHVISDEILHTGLRVHFLDRPRLRVYSNLNLYYHPTERWAYVSPDAMVVEPFRQLDEELTSYRLGEDGPAPLLAAEILSRRSFQQQDLTNKVRIYSDLRIPEYILVDVTGHFLPQRLLLKRLQADGAWRDEQDRDGGVSSELGFRLIIEPDGQLRVLNAVTREMYLRPLEGQAAARARQQEAQARQEEARVRQQTEAENQRLRDELARLQQLLQQGREP